MSHGLVTFTRKNCASCDKPGRLHEVFSGLSKCVKCDYVTIQEVSVNEELRTVPNVN